VASPRLTRRQALRLGAAGAVLGALAPPRFATPGALAATPEVFELPLARHAGATAASAGRRTTAVITAPHPFDLVGLRWDGPRRVRGELRARRRGGRWSPWTALPDAAHGPDRGGLPSGTDPVWTGPADELQLRLRGSAPGLRARFVTSAGRNGTAHAAARPRATISQAGAPPIILRAQWGGDAIKPRTSPAYGQVQLAFVHHTVTANGYTPDQSAAMVAGIARYHRDSNGWNDIGYNFLVDQYGQIFEGRAGGVELPVVGAQAQGYNSVSTGIACLGTFTAIAQNPTALDALARLIAWKLALHGMPVTGQVQVVSAGGPTNRYRSGTPVLLERISGHRDGDNTSCPGDMLYAQLDQLRGLAQGYWVPPTGITLAAAGTSVASGKATELSGRLQFGDGTTAGGAPIQILYSTAGSAFSQIGSALANGDGSWAASIVVPATGTLHARFPGNATHALMDSAPVDVTVLPTIALGLSSTRLRHGKTLAVSGVVSPGTLTTATVLYERQVGKVWKRVTKKQIKVTRGRYLTRRRMPTPGLYRVTIAAGGVTKAKRFRVLH
jgi:hypothetical protein